MLLTLPPSLLLAPSLPPLRLLSDENSLEDEGKAPTPLSAAPPPAKASTPCPLCALLRSVSAEDQMETLTTARMHLFTALTKEKRQETRKDRNAIFAFQGLKDSSAIGAGPVACCVGMKLEQARSVHVSTAAWQA